MLKLPYINFEYHDRCRKMTAQVLGKWNDGKKLPPDIVGSIWECLKEPWQSPLSVWNDI